MFKTLLAGLDRIPAVCALGGKANILPDIPNIRQ